MLRGLWTFAAPAAVLSLVALAGCSDIPTGGDPTQAPEIIRVRTVAQASPPLGSLAVAPVESMTLATDEETKGWKLSQSEIFAADGASAQLRKALEGTGAFSHVRSAGHDALSEAWREHDDYVATVSVENLRTTSEGRNLLWIPNMVNWLIWIVPSWWVATSEYSLSLEGVVRVRSGESGRDVVPERRVKVSVKGTFDEFDRGWPWLGIGVFYCTLDAEEWREVATRLFPAAERELAVKAACEVEGALREAAASDAGKAARRKTLALAVGVSRYEDTTAFPPLGYAADDARSVASTLESSGVAAERLLTLTDVDATAAAFRSALAGHLSRAREGDTVVIHFSGYGTRNANGAATLLFHDAKLGGAEGQIGIAELAKLLAAVPGNKLLVLDTSFGGRSRSVKGGGAASGDDLAPLASVPGLVTIAAGGGDEPALAPEYLRSGLLTYELVQLVKARAGTTVTASDLFEFARPRVIAQAACSGQKEHPRAFGAERGFTLELQGAARSSK